jgi:hypothetical protein
LNLDTAKRDADSRGYELKGDTLEPRNAPLADGVSQAAPISRDAFRGHGPRR